MAGESTDPPRVTTVQPGEDFVRLLEAVAPMGKPSDGELMRDFMMAQITTQVTPAAARSRAEQFLREYRKVVPGEPV